MTTTTYYEVMLSRKSEFTGEIRQFPVTYSTKLGAPIKNAKTGQFMDGRIGSTAEDNYFIVQYAVGDLHNPKEPAKLFFKSPEEYEECFEAFLKEKTKTEWYNRINDSV